VQSAATAPRVAGDPPAVAVCALDHPAAGSAVKGTVANDVARGERSSHEKIVNQNLAGPGEEKVEFALSDLVVDGAAVGAGVDDLGPFAGRAAGPPRRGQGIVLLRVYELEAGAESVGPLAPPSPVVVPDIFHGVSERVSNAHPFPAVGEAANIRTVEVG